MPDITAHDIDAFGRHIIVAVSSDDIFTAPIDAVAFKFAQKFHGADLEASQRLQALGVDAEGPGPGETIRVAAGDAAHAQLMLFVGTVPLNYLEYAEIRDLSRRDVAAASDRTMSFPRVDGHLINPDIQGGGGAWSNRNEHAVGSARSSSWKRCAAYWSEPRGG